MNEISLKSFARSGFILPTLFWLPPDQLSEKWRSVLRIRERMNECQLFVLKLRRSSRVWRRKIFPFRSHREIHPPRFPSKISACSRNEQHIFHTLFIIKARWRARMTDEEGRLVESMSRLFRERWEMQARMLWMCFDFRILFLPILSRCHRTWRWNAAGNSTESDDSLLSREKWLKIASWCRRDSRSFNISTSFVTLRLLDSSNHINWFTRKFLNQCSARENLEQFKQLKSTPPQTRLSVELKKVFF